VLDDDPPDERMRRYEARLRAFLQLKGDVHLNATPSTPAFMLELTAGDKFFLKTLRIDSER
jgi:hypothetical protein